MPPTIEDKILGKLGFDPGSAKTTAARRFAVDQLDIERLLVDWRWLCLKPMTLLARSAFGDLFLRDESGEVFRLDVAVGRLTEVADSEAEFRELAGRRRNRESGFEMLPRSPHGHAD
jgi:hypothetical protein